MSFIGKLARGVAAASAVVALTATAAMASDLSGAGSTFAYPIYGKWAQAYKEKTGIGLNYQSIGSGGGIKLIKAKTVDFGASDMPLTPKQLDEAGLAQFPTVTGGVVPVVHLAGIKPGEMHLDGKTLADIYLGKVTKWNDPEIAALNPGLKLPNKAIAVVHRSDGSGTTFIFTDYLAKVNPAWGKDVGVSTAVQWPAGIGGKGNEGVSAMANQTDGSIGYVEFAYALENHMTYVLMRNQAGNYVKPSLHTFQAAAGNADWTKVPGFYLMLTDQPGADSWPISGGTFILMHKVQDNPESAKRVLDFFAWAYAHGAKTAESLDYVPLPQSVVKLIEKSWTENIKDKSGKPVWSASKM